MMPTNEADIRNAALEEAAYREIHDAAVAAYEAATPVDYRYSALALRKAVDAALNAALAIRALKSDAPPAPEPRPFTFADPAAQLQHERLRTRKAEER